MSASQVPCRDHILLPRDIMMGSRTASTYECAENHPNHRSGRMRRPLSIPALVLVLTAAACELPTGLPRVESTFRFPVDDVVLPVTSVPASASSQTDLGGIDLSDNVRRGTIRVTPENALGATGQLTIRLMGGGETVTGVVDVAGPPNQLISLNEQQIRALLSGVVTIEASGTLCPASGCVLGPPPFAELKLINELELVVELGGEG